MKEIITYHGDDLYVYQHYYKNNKSKIHGLFKQYYENGKLDYECIYNNGIRYNITKNISRCKNYFSVYTHKDNFFNGINLHLNFEND